MTGVNMEDGLRDKRVAVIGCTGYLGSFLVKEMRSAGAYVVGYDRHKSVAVACDEFTTCEACDIPVESLRKVHAVIYLAGKPGRSRCLQCTADELEHSNVVEVGEVAAKLREDQLFIYASTAAIAEGAGLVPHAEDDDIQVELMDEYTASMLRREQHLAHLCGTGRIAAPCVGLRMGTVVGVSPKQRTNFLHVAMIKAALTCGRIQVQNPDTSRAILWTQDLFAAVSAIIQAPPQQHKSNRVYNLESYHCTVAKTANEVACKTGALLDYVDDGIASGAKGFSLDMRRFKAEFGHVQFRGTFEMIYGDLTQDVDRLCAIYYDKTPIDETDPCYMSACRVCKAGNMMDILDLGRQALANNFTRERDEGQASYPLCLMRCRECHHTQLNYTVPPERLFGHYLYVSGTSKTSREYFGWLADRCNEQVRSAHGEQRTIVEIACNDGSQLDEFRRRGWRTVGVDPAENLAALTRANGHEVHVGFWGAQTFDGLPRAAHVIMGQNVLAHVPDPVAFLKACTDVMADHTVLYIQTSQCDMYLTGEFDTAYHEHLSFFTAHSLQRAAAEAGLVIVAIEKTPVHGNSFLARMAKPGSAAAASDDGSLQVLLQAECDAGITSDRHYIRFRSTAENMSAWFYRHVFSLDAKGFTVAAYGAAAKGMTLLNYMKATKVAYIVDDAPLKQNTYSPGLNIPVLPTSAIARHSADDKLVYIVLAWNLLDEIVAKIRAMRPDGETLIVVPFPKQRIFRLTRTGVDLVCSNDADNSRHGQRTMLLAHFFNEEFLLAHWIRHHAPLFDEAILIDYASTDSSRAVIEREAPSSWKVVDSRNQMFDAEMVDEEVMMYERAADPNTWKIALNITEFLIHPCLRATLAALPQAHAMKWAWFSVNGDDRVPYSPRIPIMRQRTRYIVRHDIEEFVRFMHRGPCVHYHAGRHAISSSAELNHTGFIARFEYTPYPEIKSRKLQIGVRIPQRDRERGFGTHHVVTEQELDEKVRSMQAVASVHFDDDQEPYNRARSIVWKAVYG